MSAGSALEKRYVVLSIEFLQNYIPGIILSVIWASFMPNDALAVAMEDFGFLDAARAYSGVERLVVRGISDLIANKSEADASGWQEMAAKKR